MEMEFVLKGDICYSADKDTLITKENHYLVCAGGISKGVYPFIPVQYERFPMHDYSGHMIIPGLIDLHLHAPQYSFRGIGMDMELLDWLDKRTFPEESRYVDIEYAKRAYDIFVGDLSASATTRASIFATLHNTATLYLMEQLGKSGMAGYVGKVNMDRNAPECLCEASAEQSVFDTLNWLEECKKLCGNIKPILTPRFIPSCSDKLMQGLKEIQRKYNIPVQSHLSENQGEIAWVRELSPESEFYGDAYDSFGLFGREVKTIMAHCVYSSEAEIQRMKENGVFIAHCPQSNTNLSSGIADVGTLLEEGLRVGLGSDIAGGTSLSVFRAMTDAIQVSKLRWRLCDDSRRPITVAEAFYMGTKGGGRFFGKVGSFDEGYEADVLVLDESRMECPAQLTVRERLERFLYLSESRDVLHKFIRGKQLF